MASPSTFCERRFQTASRLASLSAFGVKFETALRTHHANDADKLRQYRIINRCNGELQDIAFQFRQTGAKIEGKLYGDNRSSPIVQGTVAGPLVTFVGSGSEQSGNRINETRTRFTGKFENGEIQLLRERESSHNAGNSGDVE